MSKKNQQGIEINKKRRPRPDELDGVQQRLRRSIQERELRGRHASLGYAFVILTETCSLSSANRAMRYGRNAYSDAVQPGLTIRPAHDRSQRAEQEREGGWRWSSTRHM